MKIVFNNGSVIETPENVDKQGVRGRGFMVFLEPDDDEENDDTE